jgi:hypothetical protein
MSTYLISQETTQKQPPLFGRLPTRADLLVCLCELEQAVDVGNRPLRVIVLFSGSGSVEMAIQSSTVPEQPP